MGQSLFKVSSNGPRRVWRGEKQASPERGIPQSPQGASRYHEAPKFSRLAMDVARLMLNEYQPPLEWSLLLRLQTVTGGEGLWQVGGKRSPWGLPDGAQVEQGWNLRVLSVSSGHEPLSLHFELVRQISVSELS